MFCSNTPQDDPHYLSFLKPFIASDSSSAFLICGQGLFQISLQIRKAQPRGWRKRTNEQTQTWVNSKRKSGGICDTFCAFCELTGACTRVKTLTNPLAMLTHLLTDLFCWLVSAAPFCWLCSFLDWPLLPTVLFCSFLLTTFFFWTFLSSSTSGLVGDLTRRLFLLVSHQIRQRYYLTGTHTHTHTTNAQHRVTVCTRPFCCDGSLMKIWFGLFT